MGGNIPPFIVGVATAGPAHGTVELFVKAAQAVIAKPS
jgi:hypothetical protein